MAAARAAAAGPLRGRQHDRAQPGAARGCPRGHLRPARARAHGPRERTTTASAPDPAGSDALARYASWACAGGAWFVDHTGMTTYVMLTFFRVVHFPFPQLMPT